MGEVYRATDARLGRDVAVKVLPEAVAGSGHRLALFEREAKLLASLNHPNLATVHEFSVARDSEGGVTPFLVMELVEGETLADRISRGPMALGETLRVFDQIAQGLSAAHAQGVVHRDLKPANIKITATNLVKILDFGLATALRVAEAEREPTASRFRDASPTELDDPNAGQQYSALTTWGESLTKRYGGARREPMVGTPGYMSPEQTCGQPVDARTDIWALGCCLFESLTGQRAFQGDSVQELLTRVLEEDPQWDLLDRTPVAIRRLVRRCLSREPDGRPVDLTELILHFREASLGSSIRLAPSERTEDELESRLFDLSHDLLCIAGFDGMLKRVNPAFERALGWRAEQLLGQRFFAFVHPDDIDATKAELANLAAGLPTLYFENRYRCADGEYLRLQWTAHPDTQTGLIFAVARIGSTK